MEKKTILDNENITLWFHHDEKIVHHRFHKKTVHGEKFRSALMKGAELLKEFGACKWLSDDREHVVLTPEDVRWSMSEWFPFAVKSGWKYWAILRPESEIGKMNMEQFIQEYSRKGVDVKFFREPDEAFTWLCSLKEN